MDAGLFPQSQTKEATMNAVAKREDEPRTLSLTQPQADAGALMGAIIRLASDPSMDMTRVGELMAMHERMSRQMAEKAFDAAMSDAQGKMRPIAADANNPQTKSKYASYAALDKALRPIYTKHGFGLSFDTADGAPVDHVRVVCRVSHKAGFARTPHIDMPNDGKGAKGGDVMTKTHAQGAAVTYGQRYLLKMIFNIAVGDDDDGNSGKSLRDRSAGFEAAVAAVNACATLDDLKAWKAKNGAGVDALPTHEATEVVRLVNERVAKLKGAQQ
jgi:hypothetical protein